MTDMKVEEYKLVEPDNLRVWNHADKIDPNYTKPDNNGGYSSLSINGYWIIKKATELFGPIGIGWGFTIMEERVDTGHTVWHQPSLDTPDPIALGTIKNHTVKIALWYELDGKRGSIDGVYGHTAYTYHTKAGKWITDGEAPKKSLTDAIKKALSMLGFAGEVYMGEYDNPYYMQAVQTEFEIQNAEEKTTVIDDKRNLLIAKIEENIESIKAAVTPNEALGVRKGMLRNLNLQTKIPELQEVATRGIAAVEKAYTAKIAELQGSDNGDS